jgi:phage-related minor tail protein
MKDHFLGATYEMTQDNWNHLIKQLDEAQAEVEKYKKAIDYIKLCHLTTNVKFNLKNILGEE